MFVAIKSLFEASDVADTCVTCMPKPYKERLKNLASSESVLLIRDDLFRIRIGGPPPFRSFRIMMRLLSVLIKNRVKKSLLV
jgi:hypothetical protein